MKFTNCSECEKIISYYSEKDSKSYKKYGTCSDCRKQEKDKIENNLFNIFHEEDISRKEFCIKYGLGFQRLKKILKYS